jgi:hypothetical protein
MSSPREASAEDSSAEETRHNVALWSSVLVGPIAWFAQFMLVYALAPWACSSGQRWSMHATILVFLAITLGVGWLALRLWRGGGGAWIADQDEGPVARTRFLALLGVMNSLLFALLILAQWIPTIAFDPCQGRTL